MDTATSSSDCDPLGTYPFGQPLHPVVQTDRTPKVVFVLGVYSSAVHARWVGPDGGVLVRALAVASEPYIFWRGDGVDTILGGITVPAGAGRLEPAAPNLNGPSGKTLDDDILAPLGVTRDEAWLCDLVPHTCVNPRQKVAVDKEYVPRQAQFNLPAVDLPPVRKSFADAARRQGVLDELVESQAQVVVLLGDEPIRHWLRHYDARWTKLSDFGEYGRLHRGNIGGRTYQVLPLAHPRQVGGLGSHSPRWRQAHAAWKETHASSLLGR